MLRDTVVLIPAAGRVPEGVLALSNISCPAMIPVAGRPVVHWTLEYLRSLGLRRFVIAVARPGLFVEDFVRYTIGADCEVEFLVPSRDGGVGLTLQELAATARGEAALVVLGDTYFRFDDPTIVGGLEPFVLVREVEESYRWCIAEPSAAGTIARLHDKVADLQPAAGRALEALIGVYYFPDRERLARAASDAVTAAEARGTRTELAPILDAIGADRPVRVHRARDWLDCGNPDRQAASHRALLPERAFNRLSIDPVLGTITKTSTDRDGFRDEIDYLQRVPAELAVLFPRVLDTATEPEPTIRMEYYGYPTLSEIFLFDRLDRGVWERILRHLFEIVTEGFRALRGALPEDAVRRMLIDKTERRRAAFAARYEAPELVETTARLRVNGVTLPAWRELAPAIERAVDALAASVEPCFVHGDLHFGNILYDVRAGICKLIDPRGRFGAAGLYGDPRYDVAKLYHSVYGLYDLLVADLFTLERRGDEIELKIHSRPQHEALCERFEALFFERFDRDEILLITGLLFVSMPPLHYDAPRRQLAMYARGLQLLGERFPRLLPSPNTVASEAQA